MKVGFGTLTTVWGLMRDNGFDAVNEAIERDLRIAVTGASPAERQAVVEALVSGGDQTAITAATDGATLELAVSRTGDIVGIDLVTPGYQSADRIELPDLSPETIVRNVGPAILNRLPGERVNLGRRLPALRELAANEEIKAYSLLNAQLAAFSNVPDLIPVLGPFIGATAEMILLTKNQIMLVYRLGAMYGRPAAGIVQLLAEILPVFGAAYLWRLGARQLAGFIPFGLGILPKVAIAFVATFAEGKAAQYYFVNGGPPPKELIGQFIGEAKEFAGRLLPRRNGRDDADLLSAPASLPS